MSSNNNITIYTDGSCLNNPGPGGWGAVLLRGGEEPLHLSGHEAQTTNNRMELTAAIKALETASAGAPVSLYTDSEYLVNTMTRNWKRRANQDLWRRLDSLAAGRDITWLWVQGHAGDRWNEVADGLAVTAMKAGLGGNPGRGPGGDKVTGTLSHLDEEGRVRMVDVGNKPDTDREATARGYVSVLPETVRLIKDGLVKKGDVLTVAQLAGIMGAKRTPDLVPLCHPLPLDQVQVELQLNEAHNRVEISATFATSAKTGVEMEALTAVSVAALTVYDMCKSVDRGIRIEGIRLVKKRGGLSGDITLEE